MTPGVTAQVLQAEDITILFGSLGDAAAMFGQGQEGITKAPFDHLNIEVIFADGSSIASVADSNSKYVLAYSGYKHIKDIYYTAPKVEVRYSDYFDPLN